MTEPLLCISNLSVSFGNDRPAVDDISFKIEKGQTVALVGESGSGKSVTALSVLQLLSYPYARQSGSIRFNNTELLNAPETTLRSLRGGKIAMIFQEPMTSLNPLHNIFKQIAETLFIHKDIAYKDAEERVVSLLETVGLKNARERLNALPHELSGGERQRVMIAMALANDPDLLIADEPTTALDVTIQAQILSLLKKLQKQFGMAVLFISHDLDLVSRFAEKTCVMQNGKIVEQGDTATLLRTPKHPYTQKLINANNNGLPVKTDNNAPVLLKADHINVRFLKTNSVFSRKKTYFDAVQNVSLLIRRGQTVALVGESGSGKTTLGKAILKLQPATGNVYFNGKNFFELSEKEIRLLRSRIQIVFQDPFSSLNPRMNIEQIIREGLDIHAIDKTDTEKKDIVLKALKDVSLPFDILKRYPHEFSGGQRQRISLARALVLNPELIVLDEPTSALDASVQSQLIDLLKQLQKQYGLSYLFISHDMRLVKSFAHSVYVMKNGKIVENGLNPSIFKEPENDYTRMLLNAAFDFTVAKEKNNV